MADETVIKVGFEGDPESYLAALNKMLAESKAALTQLEAKYADTMGKVAASTTSMNQAIDAINKQYGKGAAELPIFSQVTKEYTDEVVKQTVAAQTLHKAVQEAGRSIDELQAKIAGVQAQTRSAPLIPTIKNPEQAAAASAGSVAAATPARSTVRDAGYTLNTTEIEAVAASEELLARQSKTLADIEREVANSVGASASEMAGLYVRATTEMRIAQNLLVQTQKELGPAAAEGSEVAIGAIESLETAYIQASAVVQALSTQIKELAASEAVAAEAESAEAQSTRSLAAAQALAARQAQTLTSLQTEVAAATSGSAEQMRAVYVRAMAEMRLAAGALTEAQRTIGPAAAEGNADAVAALDSLQASYATISGTVRELRTEIRSLEREEAAAAAATTEANEAARQLAVAQALAARQGAALAAIEKEVASSTGLTAAQLRSVYVRAATEARFASNALASAQKAIGPAAASGNAEAIAALKILQQNYQAATAVANEMKLQVTNLTKAEMAEAEAAAAEAGANTAAAAAKNANSAATKTLSEAEEKLEFSTYKAFVAGRALASEGGFGGAGYALARVASQSSALGPILEAAMPVALVLGMVDAVEMLAEKVGELYNAWSPVYQAELRALKEGEAAAKQLHAIVEENQRNIYSAAERQFGKSFKLKVELDDKTADILSTDERSLQHINELIAQAQARIKESSTTTKTETVLGAEYKYKVTTEPNQDARAAQVDLTRLEEQRENILKRRQTDVQEQKRIRAELARSEAEDTQTQAVEQIAMLRAQGRDTAAAEAQIWRDVAVKVQAGGKETETVYKSALQKIGEATRQAYAQRVAELRKSNTDMMTDLENQAHDEGVTGRELLLRKIELLKQEADAEKNFVDLRRDILHQKAGLEEQADAAAKSALEKAVRRMDTEIRATERWLSNMEGLAARATEIQNRINEVMGERAIKSGEVGQRIVQEQHEGGLEMQKLRVQRQYEVIPPTGGLNPFGITPQQRELEQIQEIDLHILRDRVETAQNTLTLVAQTYQEDTEEYRRAEEKKIQAEQNLQQRIYAIETQRLQARVASYKSFFNTIETGLDRAVGRMIDGDRKWADSFRQIILDLEKQFANFLIKIAVQWLESKVIQFFLGDKLKDLGKDQQSGGDQGTTQTKTQNVQKTESYAGVAGAEEFAFALAESAGNIPYALAKAAEAVGVAQSFVALAAFEKGGLVPGPGNAGFPAVLHGEEMVLPRPISKGIQNMITNNNRQSSSFQNPNLTYAPTINNPPGGITEDMLSSHSGHMARMTKAALKGLQ